MNAMFPDGNVAAPVKQSDAMRFGRGVRALFGLVGLCALGACDSNTLLPIRDAGQDLPTESGTIQITANTNSCPTVAVTLSPPDANVGESVVIGARAFDADVGPDGGASLTLTYAWSAKAGSFEDAGSAQTRYRCDTGGPQVLTVAVSDGKCTSAVSVTVDCFALPGTVGSGGSGGKTASGGATGSGGSSGSGNSHGSGGSSVGPGSGGSASGGPGTGGTPGSGGASGGQCSGDPTIGESVLCDQCTKDNCNSEGPAPTDGCSLALLGSDVKRQKCLSLYCCLRACDISKPLVDSVGQPVIDTVTGQPVMVGDPLKCWCGTASYNDCITVDSAANGACLREVQEAAETTKAAEIKARQINPSYAIGGAFNLATCREQFCSKYTSAEMGVPPLNPIPCGLR